MERLFVGIPVSEEIKARIRDLAGFLQETGAELNFVPEENLHLTLKFLGEVPEEKISKIKEKLAFLSFQQRSFSLVMREVGVFPSFEQIRVVWVGAESPELVSLTGKVNRELDYLRKEERAEVPHLTIARAKSGRNKKELQAALARIKEEEFGRMEVDRIFLYESELRPEGARHTVLEEFALR